MKIFVFLVLAFFATSSFAEEDKKETPKTWCPKTLISDMDKCFRCHVPPLFKLRESLPDDCRNYPASNIRVVRSEDQKDIGYLLLQDIDSSQVKSYFDYLTINAIDHAIIEIHSPGGSLLDAWRIVGLMQTWERPGRVIETRCHGFAASAGFLVFVSGTKGHRFASETAEMMWHELMSFSMFKLETPSDSEESARVLRHLQDTANIWIASRGNLTKDEMDQKIKKKEFWIRGSEALELGFVDRLLKEK